MRYINRFYAPSIEVLVRDAEFQVTPIVLKNGEGTITTKDFDQIKGSEMIQAFVKDGYLEFPEDRDMVNIYNATHAERLEREKQLFGDQEDRQNAVPEDVTELTALVGQQAADLADAKSQIAALLKRFDEQDAGSKADAKADAKAAKAEAAKSTVETQAPVTPPAVTPIPVSPPAAIPPAAAPVAAPVAPPAAPAAPDGVIPPPPAS